MNCSSVQDALSSIIFPIVDGVFIVKAVEIYGKYCVPDMHRIQFYIKQFFSQQLQNAKAVITSVSDNFMKCKLCDKHSIYVHVYINGQF